MMHGENDQPTTADGAASSGSAVDPDRVYFCRECPAPANRLPDPILGHDRRASQRGLAYFLMGMCGVGVVCAIMMQFGLIGGLTIVILLGVAGILTGVYLRFRDRAMVRRLAAAGVPELPPVGSRLWCAGEVDTLLADGPLADVPFEPRVYRAVITSPQVMRLGGLLVVVMVLGPLMIEIQSRTFGLMPLLLVYVAMFAIGALRPMYFRVVPGRLDVLRYSVLRGTPMQVERYDLRSARVIVDLRTNSVFIVEGEKVGEYSIWFMGERLAFARALFEGAVSTYAAPAVSDEVL